MKTNTELINALKTKVGDLRKEIEILESQLTEKETKIQYEQNIRCELDKQVIHLSRKIEVLEDNLNDIEDKIEEAKLKLEDITCTALECETARIKLQNKYDSDDSRVYHLECLVKEATYQATETEIKYEEISRNLIEADNILEATQDEYELCEKKLQELVGELNIVNNSFKALEHHENDANTRLKLFESEEFQLKKQFQKAEERIKLAETELIQQQIISDRFLDTLSKEKVNCN